MEVGQRRVIRGATPVESPWLPLGPAARFLGVDPDTLRRWADAGRVRSFTTPGGHRRFDRLDLDRLSSARRSRDLAPSDVGISLARMEAAYRRRFGDGRSPLPGTWLDAIGAAERESFRERGRRLQLALLASLQGEARLSPLAEAERVGAEYGTSTARLGLPLTDAVAAFLASRGPLLAEVGGAAGRRRLTARSTARLMRTAGDALDRVLLAFVAAHVAAQTATSATQASARPIASGHAPATTSSGTHSRGRP